MIHYNTPKSIIGYHVFSIMFSFELCPDRLVNLFGLVFDALLHYALLQCLVPLPTPFAVQGVCLAFSRRFAPFRFRAALFFQLPLFVCQFNGFLQTALVSVYLLCQRHAKRPEDSPIRVSLLPNYLGLRAVPPLNNRGRAAPADNLWSGRHFGASLPHELYDFVNPLFRNSIAGDFGALDSKFFCRYPFVPNCVSRVNIFPVVGCIRISVAKAVLVIRHIVHVNSPFTLSFPVVDLVKIGVVKLISGCNADGAGIVPPLLAPRFKALPEADSAIGAQFRAAAAVYAVWHQHVGYLGGRLVQRHLEVLRIFPGFRVRLIAEAFAPGVYQILGVRFALKGNSLGLRQFVPGHSCSVVPLGLDEALPFVAAPMGGNPAFNVCPLPPEPQIPNRGMLRDQNVALERP
nr:MAG TPA: hypothetical protein [Caudoviricetes sp.]